MRRIVLLLVALGLLAGCGSEPGPPAPAGASGAEPGFAEAAGAAVRETAEPGAVLLDVRTEAEYAQGHAPGAVHLPLARMEAGERPEVPEGATVHVYCRTGRRAAIAVGLLRRDGVRAVNIGGLADWERAGGAVER